MKRGILAVTVVVGALCAGVMTSSAAASTAPGAPGAQSYFDLARKDCVGTARNTTSRVWFTVADGVLSDTYWPNVDATNVHTLQYVVTDGSTFTDLQTRDMTYRVVPDPTGMSCTIIASSKTHHYSITTTYIADPARDAVLMRTRFRGPSGDQVYVTLDPLAGGTGGGGTQNSGGNSASLVGSVPVDANANTVTNASNRDYAVPTFEALQSSRGFGAESVGYAGSASDGVQMLDTAHQLTPYDSAPNGHVTLTAQLNLRHGRSTNLALGFGQTQDQALAVAGAAVQQRFKPVWQAYEAQWQRYDSHLRRPASWLGRSTAQEYYSSVNVVKASEDKQFPGAIAAGLDSPWGQSVPAGNATNGQPTYFGSYREVFSRDLYEAFTGLLVAGDVQTAQDATTFLFERQQQPDGSMPRNSLENGKPAPDTGGLQLDETSYPILMDWQSGLAHDGSLYSNHVIPAADFLVAHGPSDGAERWEEQSGFSPSTISAEIAGLTAAAQDRHGQPRPRARAPVPGHRRRLCAQHQGVDGHHHRSLCAALLHPRLEDRQSQRRDLLTASATGASPPTSARSSTPASSSSCGSGSCRPATPTSATRSPSSTTRSSAQTQQRARLVPVRHESGGLRGRLRRLLDAGSDQLPGQRRPVATDRHRLGPPVAGAER